MIRETFAYVDDFTRLPPFARDLFEREANQAAVDSSSPSLKEICSVSSSFGTSIVSAARYSVETSRRAVAVAIAHRSPERGLGPTHIYASRRFESAFGWQVGGAPWNEIRAALQTAHNRDDETWVVENLPREPSVVDARR